MDGHSEIMASENQEISYQSQMMTSVNADDQHSESQVQPQPADDQIEMCTLEIAPDKITDEPQTQQIADESQTKPEQQSISDNNNDTSNTQNELNEPVQPSDKCVTDEKEATINETSSQNETINEEKTPEEKRDDEEEEDGEEEEEEDGEEEGGGEKGEKSMAKSGEDEEKSNDEDLLHERNGSPLLAIEKEKKEDEIDMNQCRVCMSSANLLDIFRIGERNSFRICDLIMKLAPAVRISERDFLPHQICSICVERIETAYELRMQCEETDKFLRSKLKRSKKTRRAPSFVIVDCAESSSDSDDDDPKSDDEFQLSEESEESSDTDSDTSYEEKKKRPTNPRAVKRMAPPLKRKNTFTHQSQVSKKPAIGGSGVVYIKAENSDGSPTKKVLPVKSVQAKPVIANRLLFRCNVCNRPCASAEALAQHRLSHPDEKCNICSLVFKQRSALLQHMERHKHDPDRTCQKCRRVFATKIECQRHVQTAHAETASCNKCKRCFANKSQLEAHKCSNDRKPTETTSKRKPDVDMTVSGRDLFKSVAPLTTTYWSDSFSD